MALSQIQALDDNHVNPRTHEAKPEFFYCQNQRLALEALLRDGLEAHGKCLKARGLRGFLSDAELQYLSGAVEPYDPGSEVYPLDAEDDEPPLSSHYWPDLSDTSIPQLELGWPDCAAYRGVTRTNVYTQPPLEGNGHIKEIVRKAIAQAQKVIAVVMDMFTDVDIFRDLLDAGFKRKVSVYILLENTALPHFLSMCRRADMHAGHLKNLRVRTTGGVEFHTRSSTKVSGRLGHRFMFVDGDKALSGSYNFTWMSSRLEKHLINVITGQAVDTFDRLFRELYSTSSAVDLRQVATDVAPEPEPLQTVADKPPSAALARKLYNPKYALVAAGNSCSPASSTGNSPKDSNSQNTGLLESKKKRRNKGNPKAAVEAPPLHPGLTNLEKAYLIPYLPTWPEPDPPSDVIGFINIIDASRPTQVHLQRSEMFGTSQAIRFRSPFSMPEESLPEVAQPRESSSKYKDKVEDTEADKKQTHQLNSGLSKLDPKALPTERNAQADENVAESKRTSTHTKTDTKKVDAEHTRSTPLSNNVSSLNSGCKMLTELTHSVSTTSSPKVVPVFAGPTKPVLNTCTPEPQNMMTVPVAPVTISSIISSSVSTSTFSTSCVTATNVSSSALPTSLASTYSISFLSTSSPLNAALPVPKPRTVQLVIKDGAGRAGVDVSEVSVVKRSVGNITRAGPLAEPLAGCVVPATQTQPGADVVRLFEKETASVPELQSKSRLKTGAQTENGNMSQKFREECYKAKQTGPVSNEKMDGICNAVTGVQNDCDSQKGTLVTPRETKILAQSHILSSDKLQRENMTAKGIRKTECETAILTNTHVTAKPQAAFGTSPKTLDEVIGRPPTKSYEAPNGDTGNVTQPNTAKEAVRTFQNGFKPPNKGLPDVVNSVNHKAGTRDPFSANHMQRHHPDIGTQAIKQNVDSVVQTIAADVPDSNVLQNSQTQSGTKGGPRKLEKDMCLHLPVLSTHTAELHSDRQPSRTPTPDSRTETPDFPIRTPTSDGHVSPRDDSTISTTSEEYYDCSELPSCDPGFELLINRGNWVAEDHVADTITTTTTTVISAATATTAITTATSATATSTPITTSITYPNTITTATSTPITTNTATSTAAAAAAASTTTGTSHITAIAAAAPAAAAATTTPISTTNTATASYITTHTTTPTHSPVTTTASITIRTTTMARSSTSIDRSAHMNSRGSSTASASIQDEITFTDTHACLSASAKPPLAASPAISLCHTPAPADSQISNKPLAVSHATPTTITTSSGVVLAKPSLVAREPEEPAMSSSLRWRIEEEQIEREGPIFEVLMPAKGLEGLLVGEEAEQRLFTVTMKQRESPAHSVKSVDLSMPGLQAEESSRDGFKSEESHTEEMKRTDLPSVRERLVGQPAGRERAAQTPALGPSGVDKRDRPSAVKETEGKKLLRITYGLPPQPRTPHPSRPARPLNPQTAKAVHSSPQSQDNSPAPRRPPPRKAPLMSGAGSVGMVGGGAGAGRRQAEEPHSRSTTPHTQPPAAQGRTRTGQTQNQPPYPKPQVSFLHSHSNLHSKVSSPQSQVLSTQNQAASQAQPCLKQGLEPGAGSVDLFTPGEEQGKAPFGFSIGKLYSLKGLKDKMGKTAPAAPKKKRSSNPPVQGHKGTG